MKFRWSPVPAQPSLCEQLAGQLKISTLLAQCLVNRQLQDPGLIGSFLEPRLRQMSDPFLLPGMSAAVDRLYQAREQGESVVIFGDYDVDGVTATALLFEALKDLGWRVDYYLPHRLEEGYGLTNESLERCLKKTPTHVLIAVDCGSSAAECIESLRARQIDVIVVDHHQVSVPAPAALALVNPRVVQAGCPATPGADALPVAAYRELCSAGLAFKLAHALVKRGRQAGVAGFADYDLRPLLDLVALGTIADLVPLTGENRILVSAGLERLNVTQRPGLIALKRVAGSGTTLGVYEVGFQLAPRLNAAGRLETAEESLHLLLARSLPEALARAEQLEAHNRERQRLERTIAEQVVRLVEAKFKPEEDFVIVEGDEPWHVGVVGIVASRVLQQFHRPTIIVGGEGPAWRGSGRSIPGFDLAAALRECADLLVRHGGHALAAGLAVSRDKLEPLRARLNELARRDLKLDQLFPVLRLDAEVRLEQMTLDCLAHLGRLSPTGQGNPPVHLFARQLRHQRPVQRIGNEKQHAKMWVTDGVVTHEAVWWGAARSLMPEGQYDLAFTPQLNEYNGSRRVQLKVLDWRPVGSDVGASA